MLLLTVVLSLACQCLLLRIPQCAFYTMLIAAGTIAVLLSAGVVLVAGCGSYVVLGAVILGLGVGILYGVRVWGNWERIRVGVGLVEAAARFIR